MMLNPISSMLCLQPVSHAIRLPSLTRLTRMSIRLSLQSPAARWLGLTQAGLLHLCITTSGDSPLDSQKEKRWARISFPRTEKRPYPSLFRPPDHSQQRESRWSAVGPLLFTFPQNLRKVDPSISIDFGNVGPDLFCPAALNSVKFCINVLRTKCRRCSRLPRQAHHQAT